MKCPRVIVKSEPFFDITSAVRMIELQKLRMMTIT